MLQKFKHPSRRAVNVSIDRGLKEEARALGVNLSRAAEAGIAAAVKAEKTRVWKIENREAVENLNDYVRENGIPLAEFQQF
jgi:antitoxin CcdA